MNKQHVIINGRAYDPVTGLPLKASELVHSKEITPSSHSVTVKRGASVSAVHKRHIQRSATLNRRHVSRPSHAAKAIASRPAKQRDLSVPVHAAISKFTPTSPTPVAPQTPPTQTTVDRPAQTHPVTVRAQRRTPQQRPRVAAPVATQKRLEHLERSKQPQTTTPQSVPMATPQPKPATLLKNEAIEAALRHEMTPRSSRKTRRAKKQRSPLARWLSLGSIGLSVMLLGGYFTYLIMPNISVRMAAVQSGINASYPGYRPTGYALRGPITYKNDEISMQFAYADSADSYTITQRRSTWDSAALQHHLADQRPTVTTAQGLTIYHTGSSAQWVNGGVLYRIDTHAPLSSEQIDKIATSL